MRHAVPVTGESESHAGDGDAALGLDAQGRKDAEKLRRLKRRSYVFLAFGAILVTLHWMNVQPTITHVIGVATIIVGGQLLLLCAAYIWGRRSRKQSWS